MITKIEYLLIIFACTSFVSIAAGNILLGMSTLLLLLFVYKNGMCINSQYRDYYYTYAIFLFTMLLSALFSGDVVQGVKKWVDLWIWRWMPFVIITVVVSNFIKARAILLSSLIGISVGFVTIMFQGFMGATRAAGFFGHPMTFAGYLCIFLPILLVCFLQKDILDKYRYVSGIAFVFGCIALFFNGTRGAWIALAPTIFLVIVYYMLQNKKYAAIGLAFLVITSSCLVNNDRFVKRIHSITNIKTDQSNMERLLMWDSAYNMFKDHPVLGVGLGQYTYNYQRKYISPLAKEPKLTHAHSNYMQMLAENGIVGFLGFIVLIGHIIKSNIKCFFYDKCPYSLMIACSTVALMIQGFTEYNFGNSAVMKVYWLVLGCLLVMKAHSSKSNDIK